MSDLAVPSASWTVPALPDQVGSIRHLTARFAEDSGIPRERLGDLTLAVSEAVTNAVLHAFRTAETPGSVTVAVEVVPRERIEVTVRDDGMGLSPRDDSPGLGLGLPLISTLADETEHRTPADGPGFELWMRFRIAAV